MMPSDKKSDKCKPDKKTDIIDKNTSIPDKIKDGNYVETGKNE